MKRLGRILGGLLAVAMAVFSLQAGAESQLGGRDFNHMTTGFPLSGGHAAAACETCHTGGVFKGTPRNCDGCHATGKRIVATPKSNAHIVTDAPCESCHFNTATWLGARFNHGSAKPGQCATCHNGRINTGKPVSHSAGNKATKSCDSCHRSSAWLPVSWNHTGVAGTCTSCHVSSPDVSAPNRKPAGHAPTAIKGQLECDSCHVYTAWYPNRFKHNTGGVCSTCHNGVLAAGKTSGHITTAVGDECNDCHSTSAWRPALGGKSATHIPYNAGVRCGNCHTVLAKVNATTLHTYSTSYSCFTCHGSNTAYPGNNQETARWPNYHESSKNGSATDCSASGCHRPIGTKGSLYSKWD